MLSRAVVMFSLFLAVGTGNCHTTSTSVRSDQRATVTEALQFISAATPANKPLGWSALSKALTSPAGAGVPATTQEQIERDAVAADSLQALTSLTALYAAQPQLRRARLTLDPQSSRTLFRVAAITEAKLRSNASTPSPASPNAPLSANLDPVSANVLAAVREQQPALITAAVRQLTVPSNTDNALRAISLTSELRGLDPPVNLATTLRLRSFLLAAAAERTATTMSAEERLIGLAADDAVAAMPATPDLSFASILNSASLNPTNTPTALRDRDVTLTVDAVTLSADTREVICGNCPDRQVHVQASTPAVLISSFNAGVFGGTQGPAPGIDFANSHRDFSCLKGSFEYIGSCFHAASTLVPESDTPGGPVVAFAITHRTWLPHGNIGAARPSFHLRAGFQPSLQSNWIGVRWKSPRGAKATVRVVSGVTAPDAITTEVQTDWAIYAVAPGAMVELQVDYTAVGQEAGFDNRAHAAATMAADTTDLLEVVDIDDTRIAQLPSVDPDGILEPTRSSPVLSYAASLQKAVRRGGWLDLETGDEAHRTAYSLARLMLLRQLADTLDATPGIAPGDPSYPTIQWRERQMLVKKSLPVLSYRLFQTHNDRLETELAASASLVPQLLLTSANVSCTTQPLSHLSLQIARSVMSAASALPTTHIDPDDPILTSLPQLQTAMVGLQQHVSSLTEQAVSSQAFMCSVLQSIQFERFAVFPMTSSATARQTCAAGPATLPRLC